MLENLKSLHKTYIGIKGGNHCQMGDKSIICKIAEKKCRPEATIPAKEQHKIISRYLIPWLDFFLKKQTEDGEIFDQILINDNAVQFIHPHPLTVLPRDQVTR